MEGKLICEVFVIKLFDEADKEIGMTVGDVNAAAYAFANSKRAVKAVGNNNLFGKETWMKKDFSEKQLSKVRNRHKLGDDLLFWVGKPLIINKTD